MVSSLRRMGLTWVGVIVAATTLWAAAPPTPSATADPKPAPPERPADRPGKPSPKPTTTTAPKTKEEPSAVRPRDLNELPAPAGAILVICREVKDALNLIPEGVFLTPEKYRAILDRIDQLERQAKAVKPAIPSACKLIGKVAGDLVQFQARFEFRTDRPRAQVTLGCQRAWLKPGATLDGQLPLLLTGEDGQVLVQVEKPGVHQVSLELELPLATRGAKNLEQGFDLGLPRAAITTLEQFTLGRSVAEVRVNGRTVRTKTGGGSASQLEGLALGPVEHLDLAWKGPTSAPQKGPPLLEVRGQIGVRVTEAAVLTDVELNLQVLWGETREWRIRMPPQVIPEVKEPRLHDEHIDSIDFPDEKSRILKIRLKEPSTEPLKVVFQVRQPRTKGAMPVGLFPVLGTLRQRGTITVSAPAELRLRFTPRGDVFQRDIAEESRRENTVAEFSYGNLPTSQAPSARAPLEIQVEEVKGLVEARVEHNLLLTDEGWRITTKAFVTPVRTKVSQLEIELPPGFQYDRTVGATPAELVDGVAIPEDAGKTRTALIKFIKEQTQPFTVSLPGLYPVVAGARNQTLEFPRLLQLQDRGGQVTVALPEGMELVATGSMPDAPTPGERQHTWRFDRFPRRLEMAWQPHRPELPAGNVIDVTVVGQKVRVRHRLSLPIGPTTPKHVNLVIPEAVAERLRVTEGGTLEPNGTVQLTPATGKEQVLEWAYSFNLASAVAPPDQEAGHPGPVSGRRYQVPLVRLAEATHADTRLRVWTDPGTWPVLAAGPWEEQPTEVVADRDSLPALVLHSGSLLYPLTLVFKEQAALPVAPAVIDHALIQVVVAEGGSQSYRARFLVSRVNTRGLDIEFPAPLALLTPEVFLDGKKITRLQALPVSGQGNDAGSILRLPIEPELFRKPALLEVRYRITPALAQGGGSWATTLVPPVPRGEVLLGRVRWQVELPAGRVPVYQGGGQLAEQRWVWLRGLLAPRPAATTEDLERWLTAGTGRESSSNGEASRASLGSWQTVLRPVVIIHAPNQLWLFACSALLLGVGLGLTYALFSRRQLGVVLIGLGVALGLAAVWWPGVLPAVLYGSEPGVVVLLLILAIRWMLQRRYRRQVVFMPGFTRLKTGSSLVRRDGNNRPRGEPSTVDAPTQRESSAKQKIEGV